MGLQRRPGGVRSEGNYLANVSDLVSALMFVFILTLAVFALRLADVTADIARVTEELTSNRVTQASILHDVRERLEDAGMRVEVVPEQGVLRLSENAINFPFGGETPIDRQNVGRLARVLADVIPCFASPSTESVAATPRPEEDREAADRSHCQLPDAKPRYQCPGLPGRLDTVLIEGHTDGVPVARGLRFRSNLELASMRAANVHRMIVACEPEIERMVNSYGASILSTSGYGSARPVGADHLAAENRRIDLRFLLEPPVADEATERAIQNEVSDRYEPPRR